MSTSDDLTSPIIHPWQPEPDFEVHQVIGKLGEEAAELATICCRIMIQGLKECEPVSGKPNERALAEEIADVAAWSNEVIRRVKLVQDFIEARAEKKSVGAVQWLG